MTAAGCSSKNDGQAPDESQAGAVTPRTEEEEPRDGGISPLLWRATGKNGEKLYLFGTIHLGDERSNTVLERLKPYLEECGALAVEFDTVAYQKDLAAQLEDMRQFLYTDGSEISDHIPAELYEQTVRALTEAGMYSSLFDMYRPAIWWQMLAQAMTAKTGFKTDYAMDTLLLNEAYKNEMKILNVESASMQLKILGDTPDEYFCLSMEEELKLADLYEASLSALYTAWLEGNEGLLSAMASSDVLDFEAEDDDAQKMTEDFAYRMYTERNIGMVQRAVEFSENSQSVFFAVGAAHFMGENGIVSLLEREGFVIERVDL